MNSGDTVRIYFSSSLSSNYFLSIPMSTVRRLARQLPLADNPNPAPRPRGESRFRWRPAKPRLGANLSLRSAHFQPSVSASRKSSFTPPPTTTLQTTHWGPTLLKSIKMNTTSRLSARIGTTAKQGARNFSKSSRRAANPAGPQSNAGGKGQARPTMEQLRAPFKRDNQTVA